MTQIMKDIMKLSIPERILMVEAIWDSIAENDDKLELSNNTKQILDERLAAHEDNPNAGSSWEDVKARIKSSI